MPPGKKWARNVFINIPFDDDYLPFFRTLLFTVIDLGFRPRIATERADGGEPRISKILQLVKESKFAIHDLSRCQAAVAGEFFRFNMPFELGLDVGCKQFGNRGMKRKRLLVMCAQKHTWVAALSDIAGSDLKAHDADAFRLMDIVRDWLVQEGGPTQHRTRG
jgi:hypothetical protein